MNQPIIPDILNSYAEKTSTEQQHSLRLAARLGLIFLMLLLIGGGLRLLLNSRDANALKIRTDDSLQRTVFTTHAKPGKLKRTVDLPATLRGYSEATLYARSNGYVSAWYKTIGDHVRKGELLAMIEAPEQTQELAQARASLEQVKVRLALARQTLARWEQLRQHDSVPQQELEEKRSAVQQVLAEIVLVNANIKRLEQLEALRRIVAPFDGVITRRSVDVGALIQPGSKELFALTQIDLLRLTVWVPQVYASDITLGQAAGVQINELQGKPLQGSIDHISGAIDTVTRSRQVDITLPNKDGKLLPGAYADVSIELGNSVKAQIVPPNALVIGQDGPHVVVVSQGNKLEFRPVKIGRDLGKSVEVIAGISPKDVLVINPSDLLEEGETVTPQEQPVALGDEDKQDKSDRKSALADRAAGTDETKAAALVTRHEPGGRQ